MTRILSAVTTLAWGLWFGAMVMLFITLGSIFTTRGLSRDVAGDVAAGLFPKFERMQLILAAVCLIATAGAWVVTRGRLQLVLFTLFAFATVVAVVETTLITAKLDAIRLAGQRDTPEFDRLHKLSSKVYMTGASILLIAGLVLPVAIQRDAQAVAGAAPQPRRAPASDSNLTVLGSVVAPGSGRDG